MLLKLFVYGLIFKNQGLLFLLSFLKTEAKERNSGQQRQDTCQKASLRILLTGLREPGCSGSWLLSN